MTAPAKIRQAKNAIFIGADRDDDSLRGKANEHLLKGVFRKDSFGHSLFLNRFLSSIAVTVVKVINCTTACLGFRNNRIDGPLLPFCIGLFLDLPFQVLELGDIPDSANHKQNQREPRNERRAAPSQRLRTSVIRLGRRRRRTAPCCHARNLLLLEIPRQFYTTRDGEQRIKRLHEYRKKICTAKPSWGDRFLLLANSDTLKSQIRTEPNDGKKGHKSRPQPFAGAFLIGSQEISPMSKYVPPKFMETCFHCPICGVYAGQTWMRHGLWNVSGQQMNGNDQIRLCRCTQCEQDSVWVFSTMVYPDSGSAPFPHDEMPADVKADFNEARGIISKSPRGAAALLRLALQRLMPHLGEGGKNLDNDIASLVKKGLPVEIQQACDTVRVIGNESVHPGTIDLRDSPEIAHYLFDLVNTIVEMRFAQPKKLQALYASLPSTKLTGIQNRDKTP